MENIIVVGIVTIILALVILYIVKTKKRGKKCIGCPYGSSCPTKGGCGCDSDISGTEN